MAQLRQLATCREAVKGTQRTAVDAVVLKDVQQPSHLTEDEDTRLAPLQLWQQPVQQDHLPCTGDSDTVTRISHATSALSLSSQPSEAALAHDLTAALYSELEIDRAACVVYLNTAHPSLTSVYSKICLAWCLVCTANCDACCSLEQM
jgi:hypothetical protein